MNRERIERWVFESKRNTLIVGICLFVGFSIGFDWAYLRPGRVLAKATLSAQQRIDEAMKTLTQVKEVVQEKSAWYAKGRGYVDTFPASLAQASKLLSAEQDGATALLESARKQRYRTAMKTIEEAAEKALKSREIQLGIINLVNENEAVRSQAIDLLSQTQQRIEKLFKERTKVQGRLTAERDLYLSSYTDPLQKGLDTMEKSELELQLLITNTQNILPAETSTGVGHPRKALEVLQLGQKTCATMQSLVQNADRQLRYLGEAEEKAEALSAEAQMTHRRSLGYVETIHLRTKYWLKESYQELEQAKSHHEESLRILKVVVERNLVDKPAVFEAAKASIAKSEQAISLAEKEVKTASLAEVAINKLSQDLKKADIAVEHAAKSYAVLESHHNYETWQDLTENLNLLDTHMLAAKKALATAKKHVSISVQRFAEAKEITEHASNASLASVRTIVKQLHDRAEMLENYRSSYPAKYNQAKGVINDQTGDIASYGSSDPSAESSYKSSKSYLKLSEKSANEKRYAQAIQYADTASSSAKGTGEQARKAYRRKHDSTTSYSYNLDDDDDSPSYGDGSGNDSWSGGSESGSSDNYSGGNDPSYGGGNDPSYGQSGLDNDY